MLLMDNYMLMNQSAERGLLLGNIEGVFTSVKYWRRLLIGMTVLQPGVQSSL
jgi:hypothetical protein